MKLSVNCFRIFVAAALAVLGSLDKAQAQVVNGGFEAPVAAPGTFIQVTGGNSFAGWSVTGNDVLIVNNTYGESGITFNAQSGAQALDITGAGNTGANSITQSIATAPGQSYSLSFWLGNAQQSPGGNNVYNLPSSVNVSATGSATQLFTNAAITVGGVNWALQSYLFTATGALTTLTFTNATAGDNYAGLDNISVSQVFVPEPTSLAVFGTVGLAGLIMARRRRRQIG